MYSCGPLHMDEQRQDDKLEPTYSSYVSIRDVTLIERGGGRGSGWLCLWRDKMMISLDRSEADQMLYNYNCSCSFEPDIIKIGQSSRTMYSNNILNFQESTTIFIAHTKKVGKHLVYRDLVWLVFRAYQPL